MPTCQTCGKPPCGALQTGHPTCEYEQENKDARPDLCHGHQETVSKEQTCEVCNGSGLIACGIDMVTIDCPSCHQETPQDIILNQLFDGQSMAIKPVFHQETPTCEKCGKFVCKAPCPTEKHEDSDVLCHGHGETPKEAGDWEEVFDRDYCRNRFRPTNDGDWKELSVPLWKVKSFIRSTIQTAKKEAVEALVEAVEDRETSGAAKDDPWEVGYEYARQAVRSAAEKITKE